MTPRTRKRTTCEPHHLRRAHPRRRQRLALPAGSTIDGDHLRAFVDARPGEHVSPGQIIAMDCLPVTEQGKPNPVRIAAMLAGSTGHQHPAQVGGRDAVLPIRDCRTGREDAAALVIGRARGDLLCQALRRASRRRSRRAPFARKAPLTTGRSFTPQRVRCEFSANVAAAHWRGPVSRARPSASARRIVREPQPRRSGALRRSTAPSSWVTSAATITVGADARYDLRERREIQGRLPIAPDHAEAAWTGRHSTARPSSSRRRSVELEVPSWFHFRHQSIKAAISRDIEAQSVGFPSRRSRVRAPSSAFTAWSRSTG